MSTPITLRYDERCDKSHLPGYFEPSKEIGEGINEVKHVNLVDFLKPALSIPKGMPESAFRFPERLLEAPKPKIDVKEDWLEIPTDLEPGLYFTSYKDEKYIVKVEKEKIEFYEVME